MTNSICITSVGAICAVGPAALARAAVAASIQGLSIHPFLQCKPDFPDQQAGLPLRCARVPTIDAGLRGASRLIELGKQALNDLLTGNHATRLASKRGRLLVAVPQPNPDMLNWNMASSVAHILAERAQLPGLWPDDAYPGDRTEVIRLLTIAKQALLANECDYCIVGGVDSYLYDHRLAQLDEQWRLYSARNLDGFVPGEAAAFIILERAADVRAQTAPAIASLGEIGLADEANPRSLGAHSSGNGLTVAIQQAMASRSAAISEIFCDLNGESYAAFEWGVVQVRVASWLANSYSLNHPAQCYGDIGCATGAMLIALAAQSKPPQARLIFTTGDGAMRAAASILPLT